ncbi:MAG: large conductance mechanosensitive channel protein MscL [Clostridia bacterium]|nr:large conductance mechanosensitive channel protein MscL [Clostridia bacterium]
MKKIAEKGKGFFSDFKKFIMKGNVLDLAVAVVIGAAFNAITNGLVKYIITPVMTYFTSGVSINEWEYVLREAVLNAEGAVEVEKISIQYGLWLQAIIDFIIIAVSIFVVVRIIKGMEAKMNEKELAQQEAEAAAKKAADDEAAAIKAAEDAEKAAKEQAILDEYYANIRAQSELLREISEKLKK